MMNRMKNMIRSEEGQGMTEYIIIVALIAIAAIGVITVFGQNLRALFAVSANALGGKTSEKTSSAGGGITDARSRRRSLADFNSSNNGR